MQSLHRRLQRHGLKPRPPAWFAAATGFLVGLALFLPFFRTTQDVTFDGSVEVLEGAVTGGLWLAFGAFDVLAQKVAWLANPVGLAAFAASWRRLRRLAVALSVVALVLAACCPFAYLGQSWKLGPGGASEKIVAMGPGFYFWLVVLALPIVRARFPRFPSWTGKSN